MKKVKGIDFKKIEIVPHEANYLSNNFFSKENENISSRWKFGIFNFSVLFKSCSSESFNTELEFILNANNLSKDHGKQSNYSTYWETNGLRIEVPKLDSYKLILISNENVF